MTSPNPEQRLAPWQQELHTIIFEADTKTGKAFDVALMIAIVLSVLVVMLESVRPIRESYGDELHLVEWAFTILFTVEYVLRMVSVGRPLRYAFSFFGLVDLLAILPTFLSVFVLEGQDQYQYVLMIRVLRLLRIFRVLKMAQYLEEVKLMSLALHNSRRKVEAFLYAVMAMVTVLGTIMYVVEGEAGGFTSIPRSIYWAIVTLTTVGYGDIAPQTNLGQTIAAVSMVIGYGIIAVPTGIVTVEYSQVRRKGVSTQSCPDCSAEGHDPDAVHCKFCGTKL